MSHNGKSYPSDVTDDEWSLGVAYLTLMNKEAPQRDYPLRDLFNGLRHLIRYGIAWRAMPHDFPPWPAAYQQAQHWLAAGCLETLAQDFRAVLRLAEGREAGPTVAIIDSRWVPSRMSCGFRERMGYCASCPIGFRTLMSSSRRRAVDEAL